MVLRLSMGQLTGRWSSLYRSLQPIETCREAAAESNAENQGINATVNDLRVADDTFCRLNILSPYTQYSGLDYYDTTTQLPPPSSPPSHEGFSNREWVQSGLGVPLD
ncbi:hypothetical protein BU25DRAFT_215447 [Macroventuria anomochaeta]|uniref:Uncharacterized protein n=1 Tax=Macroventuria anomochaeta TaxID=301207 RepID=A0ACB6RJN4_9PLEO|nr:uncharacterized protein BU25DRAFT_215447 [Macroventuria anomochaeta]KAF2622110.1 hypothetical protein BU25DRAFT_215447 [Macroventuria anomochaeta]